MFEFGAGDADRGRLRLGAAQLRLGLRQIRLRCDAGTVLVAGDAHRFGIGFGGRIEQTLQFVGDAKLQIGGGELALRGEPGIGEIGRTRLRPGDIAFDGAADVAPQIGRPAGSDRAAVEAGDFPLRLPPPIDDVLPAARAAAARAIGRGVQVPVGKKPARAWATSHSAWRKAASAAIRFWFEMSIRRSSPSRIGSL